MRASDADRDVVVSDLSEHFQAGRLTAGEFDEWTGRALTARTWGELGELVADLPAARPAAPAPAATTSPGRPQPPSGRGTGAGRHRDRCHGAGSRGPWRVGLDLAAPARAAHRAPRDLPLRLSPASRQQDRNAASVPGSAAGNLAPPSTRGDNNLPAGPAQPSRTYATVLANCSLSLAA